MFDGSGSDSIDVDHVPCVITSSVDSRSDGFLSDENFGLESMQESSSGFNENAISSEDLHSGDEMDTTEEESYKSIEHDDLLDSDEFNADFLS